MGFGLLRNMKKEEESRKKLKLIQEGKLKHRSIFGTHTKKAPTTHVTLPSMHKGGIAKETCPHMLHKGEMVIPAHVVKKIKTVIKK